MAHALVNGRVLRDGRFESGLAVLIEGARIIDVVPRDDPRAQRAQPRDLRGQRLLPGFIDTQVNGGGGVLFNDAPSVDAIRAIGQAHRRFGTTGFLPTLISDDLEVIATALRAVRDAISPPRGGSPVPGVLGVHIEGPFLNPARKGVHDPAKLRALDDAAIELLSTPTGGRTMVTLAPEMTTPESVRRLTAAGILVSAGHTNATCADVKAALAAGLRGFTHLFNAMSQLGSREPGVVGAALDDTESFCGLIVDGVHVDPVTLKLALRAKSPSRFMLVTDAMSNIGNGNGDFLIQGKRIRVVDDKLVDDEGTLAGANLTMSAAVANSVRLLDLDPASAVAMASANPASFLKLDHELGRIAAGYRASLVLVNEGFDVLESWIDGEHIAH
jgi:N-acetylglucosamine-6-phosphate deacetylase